MRSFSPISPSVCVSPIRTLAVASALTAPHTPQPQSSSLRYFRPADLHVCLRARFYVALLPSLSRSAERWQAMSHCSRPSAINSTLLPIAFPCFCSFAIINYPEIPTKTSFDLWRHSLAPPTHFLPDFVESPVFSLRKISDFYTVGYCLILCSQCTLVIMNISSSNVLVNGSTNTQTYNIENLITSVMPTNWFPTIPMYCTVLLTSIAVRSRFGLLPMGLTVQLYWWLSGFCKMWAGPALYMTVCKLSNRKTRQLARNLVMFR